MSCFAGWWLSGLHHLSPIWAFAGFTGISYCSTILSQLIYSCWQANLLMGNSFITFHITQHQLYMVMFSYSFSYMHSLARSFVCHSCISCIIHELKRCKQCTTEALNDCKFDCAVFWVNGSFCFKQQHVNRWNGKSGSKCLQFLGKSWSLFGDDYLLSHSAQFLSIEVCWNLYITIWFSWIFREYKGWGLK